VLVLLQVKARKEQVVYAELAFWLAVVAIGVDVVKGSSW